MAGDSKSPLNDATAFSREAWTYAAAPRPYGRESDVMTDTSPLTAGLLAPVILLESRLDVSLWNWISKWLKQGGGVIREQISVANVTAQHRVALVPGLGAYLP